MNKKRPPKQGDLTISLTIPGGIVTQVIDQYMQVQEGKTDDEYAAEHVVLEWLESQIDTAFDITYEITKKSPKN